MATDLNDDDIIELSGPNAPGRSHDEPPERTPNAGDLAASSSTPAPAEPPSLERLTSEDYVCTLVPIEPDGDAAGPSLKDRHQVAWSPEEDALILQLVSDRLGWKLIAAKVEASCGNKRTASACRSRYMRLRPKKRTYPAR